MRLESVNLGRVMNQIGTIYDDRLSGSYSGKPVPQHWRNDDQTISFAATFNCHDRTGCSRFHAGIVNHKQHPTTRNEQALGHLAVTLPCLDRTTADHRAVNFSHRSGTSRYAPTMEHSAIRISYHRSRFNHHACDTLPRNYRPAHASFLFFARSANSRICFEVRCDAMDRSAK